MTPHYLDSPLPRIFAHRGLAIDAPENTLAAFAAAVAAGADYIETDAHVTADGVAVLAHDPSVTVDGRRLEIRDTTAADLAVVGVPGLLAALQAFPDARFNIDVKVRDAVDPVAEAIRRSRSSRRVLLTSFDERTRAALVVAVPGVATSASSALMALALLPARIGASAVLRRILRGIPCVQVPERHRGVAVVTRRSVRAFHRAGIEVHVWTVDRPDDMRRLVEMGVDGIVTDRCDLAVEALSGYRRN